MRAILQLKNIEKNYKTKDYKQTALKKVSIEFRKSELVSILGESGSGKTTMLNIIGGLDQYDGGDLLVDGISTKDYKDSDWDAYRNLRVGFVFQSFNLIPHQTILSNVELALTLSGISPKERKDRAIKALDEVGLIEHIHKRPNQLSGGQMQRVAIARALIKDPEIILADEPTGSLDSDTSVQIMDLLKKVGQDRLIIMVTHSPSLAREYSDRIIEIRDGVIIGDSNPYEAVSKESPTYKEKSRKSRMTFLTAISLSVSNLLTKKARTLITAMAGSIGIIGIAAILALASGINLYIEDIERETMSAYPISIDSSGIDITSFLEGGGHQEGPGKKKDLKEEEINVIDTFTSLFSQQNKNDLESFRKHIESKKENMAPYVKNVQYKYGITPEIFLKDEDATVRKVNPDSLFSESGFNNPMGLDMIAGAGNFGMKNFNQLPGDSSLFKDQYDLLKGKWPEEKNQLLVILTEKGSLTDRTMYTLGIRNRKNLKELFEKLANKEELEIGEEEGRVLYDDILKTSFKLINPAENYLYDDQYDIWIDKSEDNKYMDKIIEEGLDLNIVGIIKPKEETKTPMLATGIYYPSQLIDYLIEEASSFDIVKEQLENQDVNVFTKRNFNDEEEFKAEDMFKLGDLISIDQAMLGRAFNFDPSALNIDFTEFKIDIDSIDLPSLDLLTLAEEIGKQIRVPGEQIQEILLSTLQDFVKIQEEKNAIGIGEWAKDFNDYIRSEEVRDRLTEDFKKISDNNQASGKVTEIIQNYFGSYMSISFSQIMEKIQTDIFKQIESSAKDLSSNIFESISLDTTLLGQAFQFNMEGDMLFDLIGSFGDRGQLDYKSNLSKLGYRDLDDPTQIDLYPRDFTTKEDVVEFINDYNLKMESTGQEEKVIKYSDLISALLSSVTTIIDTITYALIAFVAISLVVSSIMIGVITYVSVLERIKEIGVLRAIGASKKDIRRVFNAETLIIGFVAGVIGVFITYILSFFANIIVYNKFNIPNIAFLEPKSAGFLIGISMILAFVSGLIPSSSAAKKNPVEALRSE